MWAVAVHDLKLTPKQFYALTPRQYDALVKRRERELEHNEFMLAQLTSYLVNFSMCHPKEPTKPRDFMPSQWGKAAPQLKKVRLTRKRKWEITQTLHAGFSMMLNRGKR